MREKDIKILWGRSGNRCAICKIELTPDGDAATLGEMAHIIARSPDGPRGESELDAAERDNYSNLILLCPTHHTKIDKIPEEWPVEKLHDTKAGHEKWVSNQLDQGNISVKAIDNIFFLSNRVKNYFEFSNGTTWIVASITPLNIGGDIINPLGDKFINTINAIKLPQRLSRNPKVNVYHTRPNENGLINDDMQNLREGKAHRIQIFRNGHCEFLICLVWSVNQVTAAARKQDSETIRGLRVVRYKDVAECLTIQVNALMNIWQECLFFNDMSLNAHILNTRKTILYSQHRLSTEALYGYAVESGFLEIKNIISKGTSAQEAGDILIKDFVSYFGLVLNEVRDQNDEFLRPQRLM